MFAKTGARREGGTRMAVLAKDIHERLQTATLPCEPWPARTPIQYFWDQSVAIATFPDIDQFHPRLVERALALEHDERLASRFTAQVGGSKIFNLEQWDCPEADLIYFRALAFYREITRSPTACADNSWATTYYRGDYCAPHSHPRASVSIVYFLSVEKGGADSGGEFRIADPRISMSCADRPGFVTTPWGPERVDGTMVLFPGHLVHYVEPYWGDEPRISLAWNINPQPLPEPNEALETARRDAQVSRQGT